MVDLHRLDDISSGTINHCVNKDHSSKDLKSNLVKKRSKSQTILWLKNKFFESGCVVFEEECEIHPIDKCFQTSLPSFDKFQFRSSIFAHNCHTLIGYLSFDNIIKNICSLRTSYVGKIASPILHHLMTDKRNMNMFNDPVDPIKLHLPQYFEIITTPMDLGTVKGKLRGGHYQSLQSCFSDIELVFTNAMRFNSSDHIVHRFARDLLLEFRSEVNLAFDKCSKENERRSNHDCSLCSGSTCHLCGEKCLKFDPHKLSCQKCPQHIKKNDVYYISRDGSYVWCQKCYFSLPHVILPRAMMSQTCGAAGENGGSEAMAGHAVSIEEKDNIDCCNSVIDKCSMVAATSGDIRSTCNDKPAALLKKDLLKRCADEEVAEPWVACDSCGHWYHQICSLYNKLQDSAPLLSLQTVDCDSDGITIDQCFCCPFCVLLYGCRDVAVDLNDSLADVLYREAACLDLAEDDPSFAHVVESSSSTAASEGNVTPVRGFHSFSSTDSHTSNEINLSDVEDQHDGLHHHHHDDEREDYSCCCNDTSSIYIDELPLVQHQEQEQDEDQAMNHKFSIQSPVKVKPHPSFPDSAEYSRGVTSMACEIDLVSTSSTVDLMSYCRDAQHASLSLSRTRKRMGPMMTQAPRAHGSTFRASSLLKTELSNFLECLIKDLLRSNGFADVCDSITIRMTSNRDHALDVPTPILENLSTADRDRLPERIGYYQKCILLFQEIDGVDVCLFSVYVHEFDHTCPAPNTSAVYIAYLDSVQYFRPVEARTMVQQEVVGGYLKWAQVRGFKHAFIWSCPPHRGDYFIFNGHPAHQRNPSREHLNAWYRSIIDRCTATGIVEKSSNFWQEYFAGYLQKREIVHEVRHAAKQSYVKSGKLLKRRTGSARQDAPTVAGACAVDACSDRGSLGVGEDTPQVPVCPPIFENDYWVQQYMSIVYNHLHKSKSKRGRSRTIEQHSLVHKLKELLKILMSRAEAKHFLQPVNPRELNIPTYFQVITRPMDLGTIKRKLLAYRYTTAMDFVEDVRLTFENAQEFNPPDHPVHIDALYLLNKFEHSLNLFCKEHFVSYNHSQMTALLSQMVLEVAPLKSDPKAGSVRFKRDPPVEVPLCSSAEQQEVEVEVEVEVDQQLKKRLRRIVSEDYSLCSTSYGEHDDEEVEVEEEGIEPDSLKRRRTVLDMFCSTTTTTTTTTSLISPQSDADCGDKSFYSIASSEDSSSSSDIKIQSQSLTTTQEFSALLVNDNYIRQRFDSPPSFGYQDAMAFVADLSKLMQKASDDLFVLKFHPHHVEPQRRSSEAQGVPTATHRRPRGRASFLFKGQSSVSFAGGLRSLNAECQLMLSRLAENRIASDNSDPDPKIKSPIADSRHTFLEMSQFKHLQFDSLRRAKYSSIMLLHYLQNPDAKSCRPLCCRCNGSITDLRWHCDQCVDFDICGSCYDVMSAPDKQQQLEHSQRITADSPMSSRPNPHQCIEPFVQYHSHVLTPFRVTFQ